MRMNKIFPKTLILAAGIALFTGCSTENPFGVGYEHSACESSSKFGVCGSPEDIYRHRDIIRQVQNDYLKSGIDQELFFGITHEGRIMVKEGRTDKWQDYERSKWSKEIQKRVYRNTMPQTTSFSGGSSNGSVATATGHLNYYRVDIPVTEGTDLSVKYQKQGPIVQTRTNVGNMIRDNGLIQKIWVAPVVDRRGDLISAHEIYAVIKEPSWVIGESTPKKPKRTLKRIPTPISEDMLKAQGRVDQREENVIQDFNENNLGALDSDLKELDKDTLEIENFVNE